MSTPATILVIDDELPIRRLLELTLEPAGFRVRSAENSRDGIAMVGTERPDLILLDLGLPDVDGRQALTEIRDRSHVPVIIISVRSAESEIIDCLDAGADDYVVKPFRTGELVARLRTTLRRAAAPRGVEVATVGNVTVNFTSRVVMKGAEPIHLSSTEFNLLALFVRNAGRVLTHRFLLEHVWGREFLDETQYTRVYVGHLRKKIEDDPANPQLLLTESGIGYRFGPG